MSTSDVIAGAASSIAATSLFVAYATVRRNRRPRPTPRQIVESVMWAGRKPVSEPLLPPHFGAHRPAAARILLDFGADGYVVRGAMWPSPGPWPDVAALGEDRHAAGPDEAAEHDQHDADEQLPAHDRDEAADD